MKILVTGGAGFIGSHFIKYMLEKYPEYKIINLDKLTYCANLHNLKEIENNLNYTFIKGDICDSELLEKNFNNLDCIINFAAQTHVDNSIKDPKEFIKTNIEGTYNLLEFSKKINIKKYVQISTDEVYGSIKEGCFNENSPIAPNNPYSASKASADMITRSYFKTYSLPVVITRCSNNYGENQFKEKMIPCFINKLLNNEKIPMYGTGENIRDWIYVLDHCRAIDLVLHKGIAGEIYNIGANCEKSNIEIANIILETLNKSTDEINFVKDRPGHDLRYAICSDKIQKELNWKPLYDFNETIVKTIKSYL